MNLIGTQFTLQNHAFEIYLSGCQAPHCPHCYNPSTWDFSAGVELNNKEVDNINKTILRADKLIHRIFILGGEPLDQSEEDLIWLLDGIENLQKERWLFTRYNIDRVSPKILAKLDYIKCGPYLEEERCDDNIQYGIKLATRNQTIYNLGGTKNA